MTSPHRIKKNRFFRDIKQSRRYREERAHATKRKEKCGNAKPLERGDVTTPVIESLVANAGSSYVQLVRNFTGINQLPEIIILDQIALDEGVELVADDFENDVFTSVSTLAKGLLGNDVKKLLVKYKDFLNTDDFLELTRRLDFLKDLAFIKKSGIDLPYKTAVFIDKYDDTEYKGIVNETVEMLSQNRDKSEIKGYLKYAFAQDEFKALADGFQKDADPEKDFFWRGRVIDYLSKNKDLPELKYFVKRLTELNKISVEGTERLLVSTLEDEEYCKKYHAIADVALSLLREGFEINNLLVNENSAHVLPKRPVSINGYITEVDIVASREEKTYFIKVSSMPRSMTTIPDRKLAKLVNLAKLCQAEPVYLLNTDVPIINKDGSLAYSYTKRIPVDMLSSVTAFISHEAKINPDLLIWDSNSNLLKNKHEIKLSSQISKAPPEFLDIADTFISSLPVCERAIKTDFLKSLVLDFLVTRKHLDDLQSGLFFINCLEKLKNVHYEDRSSIFGIESVFLHACSRDIIEDNLKVEGISREAEVALSLIERGFQVTHLSAKQSVWSDNRDLIDSTGIDREIDIVGIKDRKCYLFEVVSSIRSLLDKDIYGQLKALQDFATESEEMGFGVTVPTVVLKTRYPALNAKGELTGYTMRHFDREDIVDLTRLAKKYPKIRFTDEYGNVVLPRT